MKKGFTLIEIIVSITLIVLIGVGSFVGVRYVSEKIRINKLSQITDKVLNAAQVYLEMNKEATKHLYENKEGVVIPLKLLVNEGLLDLKTTDIKESDYESEYVITALGSTQQSETCIDITTNTSWTLNKTTPLYICTDNNGNSNLKTVNPKSITNISKVSTEPYYFKGLYVNNYAKINNIDYRIIGIDSDDRIEILKNEQNYSFNDIANKGTVYNSSEKLNNIYVSIWGALDETLLVSCSDNCNSNDIKLIKKITKAELITWPGDTYAKEVLVESWDTFISELLTSHKYGYYGPLYYKASLSQILGNSGYYSTTILYSCMKITNGSGTSDNPYIIEPKNCS